jgi:hypothetical protein
MEWFNLEGIGDKNKTKKTNIKNLLDDGVELVPDRGHGLHELSRTAGDLVGIVGPDDRNCNMSSPHRVARWFTYKPKIQIWANFGGSYIDGKMLL